MYITTLYAGRKITYKEKIKDKSGETIETIKNDTHLFITGNLNELNNLKGIANEIIGKFLLLSTRGFKKYESEYVSKRLSKAKKEALYFSLYAIFNSSWNEKELKSKSLLFLNSVHYLSDNLQEFTDLQKFNSEIQELTKKAGYKNDNFIQELNEFYNYYSDDLGNFTNNNTVSLNIYKNFKNDIVFYGKYGFCNKIRNNDLFRPGFLWNKKKGNYVL